MKQVRRAFAVALVLAGTVVTAASPARAADPRLGLLEQPAWIPLDATVTMKLDIPADQLPVDEEVTLRLRRYGRVSSSEAFELSINGEELLGTLSTRRLPLAQLPRDPNGAVSVTFGIGNSTTVPAFPVSRSGVYPFEVALETEEVIASFVTWLVVVDQAADAVVAPLRVASVWSIASDPVLGVDGSANPAVVPELAPGERLDGISSLLATAGSMPLTLQISPETLEGWEALAQVDAAVAPAVDRVKTAVGHSTTQLLPAPYVPIDLTALEAAGLGTELPDQIVAGSDTLERLTGVRPAPRTAFVDPIDGPVLARLRHLLVDRVVVRNTQLDAGEEPRLQPFSLAAGSGEVRAVATTSLVDEMLTGSDPPALRVQRALTALSVIAFDEADTARGVVLAPPATWSPDVELYSSLLEAMRQHPLLANVTVDGLFDQLDVETGDDGDPVVHELGAAEPGGFPVTGSQYADAKQELASLRSTIGSDSPVFAQGERALLLALSTEQTAEAAAAQLGVIDAGFQQLNAGVTTTDKRVTLTSRRGDVPLNFRNDTGLPVRVRVRLDSTKLLFPDGDDVAVELPEGNSRQLFAVEARTSGTFTMTVTLTTGDGELPIGAPKKVTVRSAVFSGVGAALTIGALAFLALWWGNHFRRARRARAAIETS